jgi:hypothetical protein
MPTIIMIPMQFPIVYRYVLLILLVDGDQPMVIAATVSLAIKETKCPADAAADDPFPFSLSRGARMI